MKLRTLAQANEELEEAAAYYALEYEGRARRFLLAYRDAVDVALAFPSAATAIIEHTRYTVRAYPLHRFPFTIFAAVGEGEFIVLAVAHQKRRPGYWTRRMTEVEP